jgi:hypothetical protein
MVCTFLLFVLLLACIPTIDALSWMIPPLLSRSEFFDKSAAIATLLPWGGPSPLANPDSIRLPLRFLPVGGCWALKVTFSYFGIVDTGSPFLTSPDQALELALQSTKYPTSFEQYGESTGAMVWKKASEVALSQLLLQPSIILGVASPNVMRESGGIFVGLVEQDDNRPTVLQQFGYRCFSFHFSNPSPSLVLDRHSILARNDPDAMKMLDLNEYGPDLYHYAVNCDELVLNFRNAVTGDVSSLSIPTSSLDRPVVVVLDTGLTGCIFSDSLTNELQERQLWREEDFVGAQVRLPTLGGTAVVLPSTEKYWHFSSFRLPWFDDEDRHPHIIALGNTFWAQTSSLLVDSVSRRAKVVGTEQ